MATPHIDGVMASLHRKFAVADTSPEQEELLRKLQSQLLDWDGPRPSSDDPAETAKLLAAELEAEHPHLSGVVRELIVALGRIGI